MNSKIAIAHDYLIQMGGAERVVSSMSEVFPDAEIITSVTDWNKLSTELRNKRIRNSVLQHLPFIKGRFKLFFLFYPFAFLLMPPPQTAAVWISCSSFAKFLRVKKGGKKIVYCHSPTRFLWDQGRYLETEVHSRFLRAAIKFTLPMLRGMDRWSARRSDAIVANSNNVKNRIKQYYGLDSIVIYPPVQVSRYQVSHVNKGYDIVVSRLVGYKQIDLAVSAYSQMGLKLIIVGDGTDMQRLINMAANNVHFTGWVDERTLDNLLSQCRAMVFPGEEDFGIAPVEAQACGKPVIAYGHGGALETVVDGETGVFFCENSAQSLSRAVDRSYEIDWDPNKIRAHAEKFSEARFHREINQHIEKICSESC